MASADTVLALLRRSPNTSWTLKEIQTFLEGEGEDPRAAGTIVRDLVRARLVVAGRHGTYRLAPFRQRLGRFTMHPDGYGFVTPDEGGPDIFIDRRDIGYALQGDRVAVRLKGVRPRPRGVIVHVLARALEEVVGELARSGGRLLLIPRDRRIPPIPLRGGAAGAHEGDTIIARIASYPGPRHHLAGEVVATLGVAGAAAVEEQVIIRSFRLPDTFSSEALAAAAHAPQVVSAHEAAGRLDVRHLVAVTIDPDNARDHDDAVAVEPLPGGRCRLTVCIADVAHYVAPGTALDRDAYERGTSVYFPTSVLPMLPPELSSGICSLNPLVDRLVVAIVLEFDGDGGLRSTRMARAVMRSAAFLTYREVWAALTDEAEAARRLASLLPHLRQMERLARLLWQRRAKRGSLDFDLPETEVVLDAQGRIEDIVRAERTFAHRIIEEFMLAANEAVARYLTNRGLPCLYRVHDLPDADTLQELKEYLRDLGIPCTWPHHPRPGHLQEIVERVRGGPVERIVNTAILRALKQARYADKNSGHYGLALALYTHFTSPIRRYPDLVVHRVLAAALHGRAGTLDGLALAPERDLRLVAHHTSVRERVAMEAEREMLDLHRVLFMADRVGDLFDAVIASVLPFGFFVELRDVMVEGLVPVASLLDDTYEYDPLKRALMGRRTRRRFHIGDGVRVRLIRADVARRHVTFAYVGPALPGEPHGALPT